MLSIFAQLVITQSLNVTCWACPTYMYISQTHSYWGSHSVTTSHVSYCISPTLCQSDTQPLRQSVSQSLHVSCWVSKTLCQTHSYWSSRSITICKLLIQSNIMSVGPYSYWGSQLVNTCKLLSQSHIMSVRHTATEAICQSIHVSYWVILALCQSGTQLLTKASQSVNTCTCKLLNQSNNISVRHTATKEVGQSIHLRYWFSPTLSVRHTATEAVSQKLHVTF